MNAPDPKANTTTEAYLAYKAGYLEESELKPVLYEPYLHFDAWLAYWAGLTVTYPVKNVGKNLFDKNHANIIKGYFNDAGAIVLGVSGRNRIIWLPCKENTTYTIKGQPGQGINQRTIATSEERPQAGITVRILVSGANSDKTFTTPKGASFIVIRFQSPIETDIETLIQGILDTLQIEEGSTASDYEPYTGEPEMLCDEEALVAYLSGATDTYPEDIKDPYDVRIVGYLKHLVAKRWPEPDYPVNNEEFYLSTMEPPHTSNPTPSADIELDTSEGKILDAKAYGDIYQITYAGKNLLDIPITDGSGSGLTWAKNADGSITITGTASEGVHIYGNYTLPQAWLGETLTLSTDNVDMGVNMGFKNSSGGGNQFVLNYGVASSTQTITQDNIDITARFDFYVKSGTVLNDFTVHVMLEYGSTISAYEPYTGGIQSPNPNYPQGVYTVTGEQLVKTHGKNLMEIPNFTSSQQGIDAKGYNQTIELTGTAGNTYYPDFRFYENGTYGSRAYRSTASQIDGSRGFFTEPNSEYKLSIFVEGDTVYNIVEGFETKVTNNLGLVGDQVITINDSERLNFVSISISQNVTANIKVRFQIEKGSATAYQPYQSQSYEINLGKNLFNGTYEKAFIGGSAGNGYLPSNNTRSAVIPCYPNTVYTITRGASTSRFLYGDYPTRPVASDTGTVYLKNKQSLGQSSDTTATVTTSPDAHYMVVYVSNTSEEPQLQVEVGNTATPYASYFEPIELCKIGDYQDYIYKGDDGWYLHKAIGSVKLTGSLFTRNFPEAGVYQIAKTALGEFSLSLGDTDSKCDYFYCVQSGSGKIGEFYVGNSYLNFNYDNTGSNANFPAFKTWVDNNEPILYSHLATPTETKITDSLLIAQLEALLDADTYDEKTFIKVTANDPNLPALLKVEAYSY